MKSALIFTLQWSDNYGTVLQAYALQTALKRMGVAAIMAPIYPLAAKGARKYLGRDLKSTWGKLRSLVVNQLRHSYFVGFRDKHFDYGRLPDINFDQVPGQSFESFDALVYGSDNIWGAATHVDPVDAEVFFALHVHHPNKISYAASAGGNLEVDPIRAEVIDYVRRGGFRKISCREESSVRAFLAEGIPAIKVPDPTLLLNANEWSHVEEPFVNGENTIFGYDMGHMTAASLEMLCRDLSRGSCAVNIVYPNDWLKNRRRGVCLTPGQWLYAIRHSQAVVTNSFHGTAFAILFNKPFVYVPIVGSSKRYNGRADELLRSCGLESRRFSPARDVHSIMNERIDWDEVNRRVKTFSEVGKKYLKDNV